MKKILILISILFVSIFIYAQGETSKDWHMLDFGKDNIPGISVNKTYSELLTGRKSKPVVVAVIDSGVDYVHEDLKEVMWVNEDEKPYNSIDDDKNGYVDDIFGWNFIGGKNGNNIDVDNLEVTRLYKSLNYKYSKADPEILNKEQKKEYELYLKVKKEVEDERVKAAEAVDKYNTRKEKVMNDLDAVADKLKYAGLSLSEVDSLDTEGNEALASGISTIKKVMVYDPELKSIDDLKEVIAENFKIGTVKHTNTSYFTMVAKDEAGKLTQVPGLILENKTDIRRFLEAIKRKELKNAYKQELNNAKTILEIEQNKHLLDNERCKIKFE